MNVSMNPDPKEWNDFLLQNGFSPFLQSWEMGEVYRDIGEEPIRIMAKVNGAVVGICQASVVPARRGRHLSVPYGPLFTNAAALEAIVETLRGCAKTNNCSFVRMSPFIPVGSEPAKTFNNLNKSKSAPLHLLAEHVWHIPLKQNFEWGKDAKNLPSRTEEEILMQLRKTTRNLVRRAGKEGVTIRKSQDPLNDLHHFITLHEETRKRHGFTPYTNDFFRAQVEHFHKKDQCTLYLADYDNRVIAASVHMHFGGETSYHHGASTHGYSKIPASYLLQWTAITDALKRGDHVYSFWGIAPEGVKNHPFAGVTTFKKGFGGCLLELTHCRDIPVKPHYAFTRAFEFIRKWKRGF